MEQNIEQADIHQLNIDIQKKNMKLEESAQIQSEFVSNISHDFRTPLNGIIGYAELLEDKVYGDLNPNQVSALDNIKVCASDLLKMVQDILDLSRLKTNQLKIEYESRSPGDLIEATRGTVAPIAACKGLKLKTHVEQNLPDIVVDFRRIYQILVNLAGNAIKFTATGTVEIGVTRVASAVKFYVKDTGIGISDKLQELILRDFNKGNDKIERCYGGLGLGLSLSKRIIELHQGRFWLESTVKKGSCFYFTIPWKNDC